MGLFKNKNKTEINPKKKLKKKNKSKAYDIQEITDYSEIPEEDFPDQAFKSVADMQFVRMQCEQVSDSSKYIEELKVEQENVEAYILDIQKLQQLPEGVSKKLVEKATEMDKLEKKRQSLHDKPQVLSHNKILMFEKYEEEFPRALINLQNDEKYCQSVKHDMKLLEIEKKNLKKDMENYSNRTTTVKNVSFVLLFILAAIFLVFFISGQTSTEGGRITFFVVMLLSVVLIALVFIVQRHSVYGFKLAEKKLVKTVSLLNKVKIKYVNIVNLVDYQHEKYGVKNSYILSRDYEAYLNDKKITEKYHRSVKEFDFASAELMRIINGLNLNDAGVWEKQYTAFVNPEEMNEIKKRLISRNDKLKKQMNYNIDKIDNAKKAIMKFLNANPTKSKEIMEIINSYDTE